MDLKPKAVVIVKEHEIKSEDEVYREEDKLRTLQSMDSGLLKDLEELLDDGINEEEKEKEHVANDTVIESLDKEKKVHPWAQSPHSTTMNSSLGIDDAMMD